jgi:hypothetical protein
MSTGPDPNQIPGVTGMQGATGSQGQTQNQGGGASNVGMSQSALHTVMNGMTTSFANAMLALKSTSGPKIEMKPLKVDENDKILEFTEQVVSQVTLSGFGDAFDESKMMRHLPDRKDMADLMDVNVPDEYLAIQAVKNNKKGIAFLTSVFIMLQHGDLIKSTVTPEYPNGLAYEAIALLRQRALPQKENAKFVLDTKLMNLSIKEQDQSSEKMRFGKKCVSGKTSLGRNANLTQFEVFSGFAFRPQCRPKRIFSKDWKRIQRFLRIQSTG